MANWKLTRQINTELGRIAYETHGSGEPLVMIHGTPFSSYVWRQFVDHLSEYYQVYVYDLLGYGQSEKHNRQDVSLGTQSKLLYSILKELNINQPTIVAHDFGGATSLRTHLLNNQDYKQLILIDPVAVAPWGSPFVQHVRRHYDAFETVPSYIHSGILNAYIQDAAFHPLSPHVLEAYKQPWLDDIGQPAFYRQIAQMDQKYTDEIEPRYGEVRCQVSIIWGQDDMWIPVERGRLLHQMIPHSDFEEIPRAGHLVQEDQPEVLLDKLLAALTINE